MDYNKDIEIDEDALDVEWLMQPKLMLKYTRIAADLRADADIAEEKLDVLKAQIEMEVREDPERFGIAKVTEAAVKATILLDKRYKEANSEFIEAKREAKAAEGAVKAFDNRKDALENLVRLFGQSYFAGPKMPRNIHEEMEKKREQQTETNKKITEKLKVMRRK